MGGDVGDVPERALVGRASWLEFQRSSEDVLLEAVEEGLRVGFWMDV